MTKFSTVVVLLLVIGCSEEQTEEFVFKKTMEYQLKDDCGKNKDCISAVEKQIESCMEKSDWRKYLKNSEDEEELNRFIKIFFPCFKDPNGNSYF
jgi:hypothetical protein